MSRLNKLILYNADNKIEKHVIEKKTEPCNTMLSLLFNHEFLPFCL